MALTVFKAILRPKYGILWLGFVADENRRIEIARGRRVYSAFFGGRTVAIFVEAMACGLACLATDVGADGEVLDQGVGYFLILGG